MPRKRKAKDLLWSTSDYYGNQITLGAETWDTHVLMGHPEMSAYGPLVKQTVEQPYEIRESTQSATALAFASAPGTGPSPEGIRVLVNYADMYFAKGATSGAVMTAYPVDIGKFGNPRLGKTIYRKGGGK
jgi:hypothetical protein